MNSQHSVLREISIILILIVGLSLVYNAFSAKGLPLIRVAPVKVEVPDSLLFGATPGTPADTQVVNNSNMKPEVAAPLHERALSNPDSMAKVVAEEKKGKEGALNIINLDQLKRLLAQKRGVLLDARSEEEFRSGHIRGARNMFALEIEKYFDEIALIPRDTVVIIYCNNPECHLGRTLAEFMASFDFTKLYLYDDGWDGWTAAHMPVDTTMTRKSE